jgi:hypothetical protein
MSVVQDQYETVLVPNVPGVWVEDEEVLGVEEEPEE